jgi:hypothetical protein
MIKHFAAKCYDLFRRQILLLIKGPNLINYIGAKFKAYVATKFKNYFGAKLYEFILAPNLKIYFGAKFKNLFCRQILE